MKSLYFILSFACFNYVRGGLFDSLLEEPSEDDFEYPCSEDNIEEKCVQEFFEKSSSCKPSSHQDGDAIFRPEKEVYFPKINLTVITTKSDITYHNSNIRAFYINKKSNNLVFAVNFDYIQMYSQFSYFLFHQVAKEPIVAGDFVNGSYPCTLTAIFNLEDGSVSEQSLKNASITAYLPTGFPPFVIGPKVALNPNPVIVTTLLALLADIPTAVLEIFLSGAPHFFLLYLQNYICDFGIDPNSHTWGNTIFL